MSRDQQPAVERQAAAAGRLLARPVQVAEGARRGRHPLGLDTPRDGILCVPIRHHTTRPAPLMVLLHGAGGSAKHGRAVLQWIANVSGIVLLVPESRQRTWDVIRGSYGPDVAFIDQALAQTFGHYAVDPRRLIIGGFSDGASYALSLGLTNGDLFTHVIAFSPGFTAPAEQHGRPRIFITHGTRDRILPIDRCSRRIVQRLRSAGYDVRYREF
ncbi:MAG: alpha/beta hydrolase-fold protein, partial [Chloroflexota bacterium]|nr:alpha/beta hydrolase-fold protein [Chloroflexota bacterium]